MPVEVRSAAAPDPRVATAALLFATVVWGATFVSVKSGLGEAGVFTFLTVRFAIGALAALSLSLLLGEHRVFGSLSAAQRRTFFRRGALLGVLMWGGYALQTAGLQFVTPNRSAFLTGLTVLFVPFVSWFTGGERPPPRAFVAPWLAVAGVALMSNGAFVASSVLGDALTLGCCVVYAAHIVGVGRWSGGFPPLALTALQLVVVCVLSAPGSVLETTPTHWSLSLWVAVLFTGVCASALAVGAQSWAQPSVSAERAAVIYALEPVFAVAFAAGLDGARPTASELLGGSLIIGALVLSEATWLDRRQAA